MSSEDGDYSLMSGPGHYYLCPKCKNVFRRNWSFIDNDLTVKDYSYEKDNALPYLLSKAVSKEFQEVFIKDVSWFQGEVIKGEESLYYDKTSTHDAVKWTKNCFWEKLFKYLKRKEYAEYINMHELMKAVEDPAFERYTRFNNSINNVKCESCNGQAFSWSPSDGCPKCGSILELEPNSLILVD
jgi:rubrerythrin